MLRISDYITDSVWSAIQEPTEWQRIGNQIDTAFIFARADFVNVSKNRRWHVPNRAVIPQSKTRVPQPCCLKKSASVIVIRPPAPRVMKNKTQSNELSSPEAATV
jgi:hypothetical protein